MLFVFILCQSPERNILYNAVRNKPTNFSSYSWQKNISSAGSGPINTVAEPLLATCLWLPLWNPIKICAIARAFHYTSLGVLSIGALPPGSPHRASTNWERLHFQSVPSHILRSFQSSRQRALTSVPIGRDAPFREPSLMSLKVPGKRDHLHLPKRGPYGERCPFPEPSCTYLPEPPKNQGLLIKSRLSLKVPCKGASPPSMAPQRGPYGERYSVSKASGSLIYVYICHSPQLHSSFTKTGWNTWSPSMEPHADGRSTYNGAQSTRVCRSNPLQQCFSNFVRSRPGKFFYFYKTRPGPNKFTLKYFPIFLSSYIKLT